LRRPGEWRARGTARALRGDVHERILSLRLQGRLDGTPAPAAARADRRVLPPRARPLEEVPALTEAHQIEEARERELRPIELQRCSPGLIDHRLGPTIDLELTSKEGRVHLDRLQGSDAVCPAHAAWIGSRPIGQAKVALEC